MTTPTNYQKAIEEILDKLLPKGKVTHKDTGEVNFEATEVLKHFRKVNIEQTTTQLLSLIRRAEVEGYKKGFIKGGLLMINPEDLAEEKEWPPKENRMSKITKIIRTEYAPDRSYALVHVQLNHGGRGSVWVGGDCEEYYHAGRTKVFIKRPKGIDNNKKDKYNDKWDDFLDRRRLAGRGKR